MTGNNPTDRSKLDQAKRHILIDIKGIPLSAIVSSASTHDVKIVTDFIDNAVIKRPISSLSTIKRRRRRRKEYQHLCLDMAYSAKSIENEIFKWGYIPHIPHKRKRPSEKEYRQKGISFQK